MHNISIIFLFLVFRDMIAANGAMQWRHVIDIPRDLFLKTAEKVQPFSFFFHLLHFLTV